MCGVYRSEEFETKVEWISPICGSLSPIDGDPRVMAVGPRWAQVRRFTASVETLKSKAAIDVGKPYVSTPPGASVPTFQKWKGIDQLRASPSTPGWKLLQALQAPAGSTAALGASRRENGRVAECQLGQSETRIGIPTAWFVRCDGGQLAMIESVSLVSLV